MCAVAVAGRCVEPVAERRPRAVAEMEERVAAVAEAEEGVVVEMQKCWSAGGVIFWPFFN